MTAQQVAIGAVTLALLCACSTATTETPATLLPTAAGRAALQSAVGSMLKREKVLLADDALVHETRLVVEPARIRDGQGVPIQGRELRAPERFELRKNGATCALIHENSGARVELVGAECAARE